MSYPYLFSSWRCQKYEGHVLLKDLSILQCFTSTNPHRKVAQILNYWSQIDIFFGNIKMPPLLPKSSDCIFLEQLLLVPLPRPIATVPENDFEKIKTNFRDSNCAFLYFQVNVGQFISPHRYPSTIFGMLAYISAEKMADLSNRIWFEFTSSSKPHLQRVTLMHGEVNIGNFRMSQNPY